MSTVVLKLKRFIYYGGEVVEIMGASFKIGLGLWLAMPFWQSFTRPTGIFSMHTEPYWSAALLIIGSLHGWAVISGTLKFRKIMTMAGFIFWLWTATNLIIQNPASPLIPFFALLTIFMGMNNVRLYMPEVMVDRRVQDLGPLPGQPERRVNG